MRTSPETAAERLHDLLVRLFGRSVPVRIRAWDDTEAGPSQAPLVRVRSRRALRRLLWRPDELGLARAFIAGELDVDESLVDVLSRLEPLGRGGVPGTNDRSELLRLAVLLGAVGPQPRPPDEETGAPPAFDDEVARAILGPALTTNAGVWDGDPPGPADSAASSLEAAETAGLDLIRDRLGLEPGSRVLDLAAGWGAFAAYASRRGISGRAVVPDASQIESIRSRVGGSGFDIDDSDWREGDDESYDAVIALGETGPALSLDDLPAVHRLLRPGGRLLAHVVGQRHAHVNGDFRAAYLGSPLPQFGDVVRSIEGAGLELITVESIRSDLAATVRCWAANIEASWDSIVDRIPAGHARTLRLLLAGYAVLLSTGKVGAHRLLAVRLDAQWVDPSSTVEALPEQRAS